MSTVLASNSSKKFIDDNTLERVTKSVTIKSGISKAVVTRGVTQAAALWTSADGTKEEFAKFCEENICKSPAEKEQLFYRLCHNFESIFGHNNRVIIDLLMPSHVSGYENTSVDQLFGAYDGLSHFYDDMFQNKIAFIIILNFPHYTLAEKNLNGANWSNLEWGYVRLGDVFTSRVPAAKKQAVNTAIAAADNYIANYNIYMGMVWSNDNVKYWSKDLKLISHWGLRDELKSAYADKSKDGVIKQKIIYNIMKRIVDQSIKADVINKNEYIWYPSSNQTFLDVIEIETAPEKDVRYQHLLNVFKAVKATDEFFEENSTYITRKFDDEYEISVDETEKLFKSLLSSPQVKEVAKLISQRLDRKLEPFDIWYDGFKTRSAIDQNELDRIVKTKYPDKEAFARDLPRILTDLGFTAEKAEYICTHVTVDPSVGAGHAWESMMRSDNARLRTRIGTDGMDYKGYNIGIHEFGHNVEQTISLHDVPNYFLRGVPNTAFTEALAFTFQSRDLQLLGLTHENETAELFEALDTFWSCYEIMGVALVDVAIWKWMYAHPNASATDLKNAVVQISKDIWNQYYEPIFKTKDQVILGVYSHIIDAPLYLSAYPIGHLIEFQIGSYLKGKNIGEEVERMFKIGRRTPAYWMKEAVGAELSVAPLIQAVTTAIPKVIELDKENAKAAKKQTK